MDNQQNDFNEDQLRKKIQRDLEQRFRSNQDKVTQHNGQSDLDSGAAQAARTDMKAIRNIVEWEVYSQHAEFLRCENHLNEVRWLTPLELEKEYEFYPVEEKWFTRRTKQFYWKRQVRLLKNPKWEKTAQALREQLTAEIKQRLEHYHLRLADIRKQRLGIEERRIYQEEVDRFYSGKEGYKKYRNHSGETRWMTEYEFQSQDEFYEEVISNRQKIQKWLIRLAPAVVILITGYFLFFYEGDPSKRKSFIIINSNEDRGHLYVDKNLIAGFKINMPTAIDPGEREVSFIRGGFVTNPKQYRMNFSRGDTTVLNFELRQMVSTEMGIVIIDAPYGDANVFIDGDFQGSLSEQPQLMLTEGAHTIYLEKVNYSTMPPQHIVNIQAGDTVRISYKMAAKKDSRSREDESVNEGMVAVTSNINNADIHLDGQKTGFQTDYVLQKIPYGQHVISVSKAGYKVYPEERVVRLTRSSRSARTEFTLSSTTRQVTIETSPVDGSIIIDGKEIGQGRIQTSLPLGRHIIEFSEVDNYQRPRADTIEVTDRGPANLKYFYAINFSVSFTVGGIVPEAPHNFVKKGYSFNDGNFRVDDQYGPDIQTHARTSKSIWRLGYTFQYKNPPGSDGIEFYFSIPDNFDLNEPLNLKLWAYQSKDNYPLAINGKSFYAIDINNRPYRKQLLPTYQEDKLDDSNYDTFPVNTILHHGQNKVFITTLPLSTAHLYLWKVAIE